MSVSAEDQFLNSLSKRIAETRKNKSYTQEKLASEASIDRVALANIETCKRRPTITTVYRIAAALNVRVEDLVKGL